MPWAALSSPGGSILYVSVWQIFSSLHLAADISPDFSCLAGVCDPRFDAHVDVVGAWSSRRCGECMRLPKENVNTLSVNIVAFSSLITDVKSSLYFRR